MAFSPLEVASVRIISAALFMLPFVIRKFARWRKGELFYLFIVGFTGSLFPAILFAVAQTRLASSVTGVLNATTPMFVAIIGALFFGNKITFYAIIGILIGFAGSAVLITGFSWESFAHINSYALFVILATLCYGINLNIIKFRLKNVKPLDITGISVVMVLPLATLALFFFTDFTSKSWESVLNINLLAVVVLGVLGTGVALLLFNKMVKISSPVFAGSVTYLIPIVAVLWGLLDGESLLFYQYAGLLFIITGVLLINRKTNK